VTRRTDAGWMQTYTGRAFWPLDPNVDDVDPVDIAHALAHLCRYGGHTKRFYCPTPEQRVLTADMRWVPAGDLNVGDELLGFDEFPHELGQAGKRRRRYRPSTVLTAIPVKRPTVRLVLADGSDVTASAEHPWLVATKVSRNQTWVTAGDIATAVHAGRRRYMHRFIEPWQQDTSRDGGWLAGILDGEGHVSTLRTGVQFGVAQRPGLVLNEIGTQFARLGFDYRSGHVGTSDVVSLQVRGGWRELARLLGTVRPVRLLDKFTNGLRDGSISKQMNGREPVEIVAAYDEGEQWVAGLETSTHTYLCEGFGAHNSVAEHCVLMSQAVAPEHALWALLHDASEAYVVDVPRPLKHQLPDYMAAEQRVQEVIVERFGLDPVEPVEVKAADSRILLDEREALLHQPPPRPWPLELESLTPLGVVVVGWRPPVAEWRYLERLNELGVTT
jgi:hypothetical protein